MRLSVYCLFCSQWKFWRDYRVRDPIKIVDEIEKLVNEHDVGFLVLADEGPTINRKKFIQFCEARFHYPWRGTGCRRRFLPGCLKALLKAGVSRTFHDLGKAGYWGPQTKNAVHFDFDETREIAEAQMEDREASAERLCRALQPYGQDRMAGTVSLRKYRRGPGSRNALALDIQQRPNMGIGGMTSIQKLKAA